MEATKRFTNMYYLGPSLTERDLFAIISPLTTVDHGTRLIPISIVASALEGDIGEGGLNPVLQLIDSGSKTGCLLVSGPEASGTLYAEDGFITYAASGNASGQEAVMEFLDVKSGHFRFVADKKTDEKNCSIRIMAVLMEWAKEKDETRLEEGG
jgi:hypothetical protein